MHAKLGVRRQAACLVEEVQVVQSELLRNWLVDFNRCHVLLALGVFVRRQGNGALARLSVDFKGGSAVLCLDSH